MPVSCLSIARAYLSNKRGSLCHGTWLSLARSRPGRPQSRKALSRRTLYPRRRLCFHQTLATRLRWHDGGNDQSKLLLTPPEDVVALLAPPTRPHHCHHAAARGHPSFEGPGQRSRTTHTGEILSSNRRQTRLHKARDQPGRLEPHEPASQGKPPLAALAHRRPAGLSRRRDPTSEGTDSGLSRRASPI